MRDHRRRVEIRMVVVREEAETLAKVVAKGKQNMLGHDDESSLLRHAAHYSLERIAYFQTDDPEHDRLSYFPREFQRANPRIPWTALADLYDRLHHQGRYDTPRFWGRRDLLTDGMLWRWATVRIPRIIHLLEQPSQPERWQNEPHGSLGIVEALEPHRTGIRRVMRKYGIKRVRAYGSIARGEADERSDADLLVDRDRRRRFRGWDIERDLETVIGRRVSVTTEEGLYHATRDRVLSEAAEFARVGSFLVPEDRAR